MTAILFAGPTLHGFAGPVSGIELRPPAVAGDVARAAREGPRAIGIIDGAFGVAPSIWHKEILDALDRGIPVMGGGSLGAIRAAELRRLGMTGVGRIYRAYASGRITRDDAVLVLQAPAALGYAPLTVALVDAEHSIRRCPLPEQDRAALLRIARRTYFADRTWATLAARRAAEPNFRGDRDELAATLAASARSLKREDARRLIDRLGKPPGRVRPLAPPRLVVTSLYRAVIRRPAPASPV